MISKLIISIVACAVIATIIGSVAFTSLKLGKDESKNPYEHWNRSGPFAINKAQYKLGENIFVSVSGLSSNDVGKIIFGLPNGTTVYSTIPFDGGIKSEFNTYFTPSLSKEKKICSINDMVGRWFVVFRDTKYKPITFEILNETMEATTNFKRVC